MGSIYDFVKSVIGLQEQEADRLAGLERQLDDAIEPHILGKGLTIYKKYGDGKTERFRMFGGMHYAALGACAKPTVQQSITGLFRYKAHFGNDKWTGTFVRGTTKSDLENAGFQVRMSASRVVGYALGLSK